MQKLTLIFSDTEFGAGTATDDFVEDELLAKTIKKNVEYKNKYQIDLVFNGDTFDFAKCPHNGKYPRHITQRISLDKLEAIHKAHPVFFKTLKESLSADSHLRIIFIHGNHDFDIEFPKVQKRIIQLITGKTQHDRIIFAGFEFTDNLVHIEHGSQLDTYFRVDPKKLVYDSPNQIIGEPFLFTPWGYNALYDHFIHIKADYPLIERLHPRARTIELLPFKLKKRVIFGTLFYLIKAFVYTQFRHWNDALYRFSVRDFRKYFTHFMRGEYDVKVDKNAKRKLKRNVFQVICFGHTHRPRTQKMKHKWFVNTGNWRDEYQLNEREKKYLPKPKTYAFIVHEPTKIHKVSLIEVPSRQRSWTIQEIKDLVRKPKERLLPTH